MAIFKGTMEEFNRYIGPRICNMVKELSKPYKKDVGQCQHCGANDVQLDAAHRHGSERPALINQALEGFISDEVIHVDLSLVDKKIRELHDPIEKVILVLCNECHRRYDTAENKIRGLDALPITLNPIDVEEFKARLLKKKCAEITIYYLDGRQEIKNWNVQKFNFDSDVIGNLRSRPEFRNGNWQDLGIREVCVKA